MWKPLRFTSSGSIATVVSSVVAYQFCVVSSCPDSVQSLCGSPGVKSVSRSSGRLDI